MSGCCTKHQWASCLRCIGVTTLWSLLWNAIFYSHATAFSVGYRSHQGIRVSTGGMVMKATQSNHEADRRRFLGTSSLGFLAAWNVGILPADARGLVQFPCTKPLFNTYHFMRAGESLLEADDIWSTNPLFLTNREAALSDRGIRQVEDACRLLQEDNVNPTLVRYSLAASAVDTANILGQDLNIGRDRLVPEFNFMDPRAVGKWDMLQLSTTQAAVFALDADEAGTEGKGGRLPPNEDSTPHETLADQAVRLRQLLSVLETQFSGDTILLIFPDGTGPALLSAMIAGIPLTRVHELEFRQAEVRLNVTMDTTLALLAERENALQEYTAALERGRNELRRLRDISPEDVVSVKDQQLEEDRIELDRQQEIRERQRKEKEEATRSAQLERSKQKEAERKSPRDVAQGDIESSPSSMIVGAVGTLAIAGGLALVGASGESSVATETNEPSTLVPSPAKPSTLDPSPAEPEELQPTVAGEKVNGQPGNSTVEASNGSARTVQKVNGDSKSLFTTPPNTLDHAQRAGQAMKDYLNDDDGGESWLRSLSEIIQEDDDEEDIVD